MGKRWTLVPVAAVLLATACGSDGRVGKFCTDYGAVLHELVLAARDYPAAPEEFGTTLTRTMSTLDDLRWKAPDERLRNAFDTAAFTFTVFSEDAALADFLTRADFSTNAMVLACSEYGVVLDI